MPISTFEVPLVPVRLPGEKEYSWVDLIEELNNDNILFLFDELEAELSNEIMALMMYLGMEDNTQPLYLFINSPGGEIINGMAIDNVMQNIRSPVMTICLGLAASMASYILAGGACKHRVALPHARIMIHEPYVNVNKYEDEDEYEENEKESVDRIYVEVAELLTLRETLTRVYSERTGKPIWIISQDMERDTYMSATEAQAYGIVDRVGLLFI